MIAAGQPLDLVALAWAVAATCVAACLLMVAARLRTHRTRSLVRLDWFVPFRPARKRGPVRRFLRRLGMSWLASPVRRLVQACFLLLFLYLFSGVCWPYSARPPAAGFVSPGWRVLGIDQQTGELRFERSRAESHPLRRGQVVYLFDASDPEPREGRVGRFRVSDARAGVVALRPDSDSVASSIDAVLTGSGPWTIRQRDVAAWPSHYRDDLARKEWIRAEWFLLIDPLVSLSTAIASRSFVWSLTSAAIILVVCLLVPRGFCGYLCPLGTTIDLFDWLVGRKVRLFRVSSEGWWVHIKYYLLAGTLMCAVAGVLVSGFVSAIPVMTRGMLFLLEPAQIAVLRGTYSVPPMHAGHLLSVVLFVGVLALGLLRPRFWCKYVCPSGAVFSLGNLLRLTERQVESTCIHCNQCVEICPFDAIKPDFTTRTTDCTLCQSCAGVCPTEAIKFVERWNRMELKAEDDPPTGETGLGRRGFLSLVAGGAAAVVGSVGAVAAIRRGGAQLDRPGAFLPVRPPGSVPEEDFLRMCIRCGECFKVCPNHVLQAEGFQQGLEGLWTPLVQADWAGCEPSCNNCGQVCPTGAIRALSLEQKRTTRMGLAEVNQQTCLPLVGRGECDLCVQECRSAGYHAIEFIRVGTKMDAAGRPIEGSGFLAPNVLADRCVGCGLCQTRCYHDNVVTERRLRSSAIVVVAGEGKEDRFLVAPTKRAVGQPPVRKRRSPPVSDDESVPAEEPGENPFGL